MAKKPAQTAVAQTKADPKRERTIKNRQRRLEAHLSRFPEDKVAKAALGKEKPARKTPKTKGAFPKPVIRIQECLPVLTGKKDKKTGKAITKPGSGFVSSKHQQGKVLTFGSTEPIMVEKEGKFVLNPEIREAWEAYLAKTTQVTKRKRNAKK
ncbi:hypothetical protein IACHDJAJ_00071 [Aeromonas phage vB_AdhS_TS3]|nr:hypothetical protein IACHDJAJ_00071 [Aeromonas phage vB_AdhS_TS3]